MNDNINPIENIRHINDTLQTIDNKLFININLPHYYFNESTFTNEKLYITLVIILIAGIIAYFDTNFFSKIKKHSFEKPSDDPLPYSNIQSYFIPLLLGSILCSISMSLIIIGLDSRDFHFINILYYGLVIFGYHFILITLCTFFGWIYNKIHISTYINLNALSFLSISGLISLPLVISSLYLRTQFSLNTLHIACVLLVIIHLIKIYRFTRILYVNYVPILYLILYLCAVEFMPMLIVCKFVNIYY